MGRVPQPRPLPRYRKSINIEIAASREILRDGKEEMGGSCTYVLLAISPKYQHKKRNGDATRAVMAGSFPLRFVCCMKRTRVVSHERKRER